jgi:hypothetical protein
MVLVDHGFPVCSLFTHTVKKKTHRQVCYCLHGIGWIANTLQKTLADGLHSLVSDTLPLTPCPKMEAWSIIV